MVVDMLNMCLFCATMAKIVSPGKMKIFIIIDMARLAKKN
jgi:hypothetical protein